MIYSKACPDCRGDIYESQDTRDHFWLCLECGRIWEPPGKNREILTYRAGSANELDAAA